MIRKHLPPTLALLLSSGLATAATFTVTNTNDAGVGSLRQAVLDANVDSVPDLIEFNLAPGTHTILLTSGDLNIDEPVIIDGPDDPADRISISGDADSSGTANSGDSRIFDIGNVDGTVILRDLTLSRGYSFNDGGALSIDSSSNEPDVVIEDCTFSNNTCDEYGGAIYMNARDVGSLTLTNCVLDSNVSTGTGTFSGSGGAIGAPYSYSDLAPVTLTDCTVSNNQALDGSGGGIEADNLTLVRCLITGNSSSEQGGGIYSESLMMVDCTVSGNSVTGEYGDGGGIDADDATLVRCLITGNSIADGSGGGLILNGEVELTDCSISDNSAAKIGGGSGGEGGGLHLGFGTTAVLTRCTISGNSGVVGGGLYCSSSNGTVEIANSTISGNSALEDGGGLRHKYGEITLSSCTITANTADSDSDDEGNGGGIESSYDGAHVTLRNTIVAGNFDTFVSTGNDGPGAIHPDVSGTFESAGHNLIGISAGQDLSDSPVPLLDQVSGDLVGKINKPIPALLSPLQDNGGLTATHRPQYGSPAIEAGDTSALSDPPYSGVSSLDQTGAVRLVGMDLDMGAVEYPKAFIVSTTADSGAGSLRQAVIDSQTSVGGGVIVFDTNGAYNLPNRQINLSSPISIGDKLTIAAPSNKMVTLDGGGSSRILEVTGSGNGAVRLEHLTLRNGHSGGSQSGGAISFEGATTKLELEGCTLDSNHSAANGGAIFGSVLGVALTLLDCTLSNNTADGSGGALAGSGMAVEITNSTFSGNSCEGNGGGADLTGCTGLLRHSTVTANDAGLEGGGLAKLTLDVSLFVVNCLIAGNTDSAGAAPEVTTNIESNGYNLLGIDSGAASSFSGSNNDLLGSSAAPLDPLLGPLANNGGSTLTHALLTGSPAIDAGTGTGVASPPYSNDQFITDQRGQTRTFNAIPDMGAFEYPPEAVIRFFVDDADASEFNADRAVIRVYRTRTEGDLTVRFSIDGASTASNSDYILGGDALANGSQVEVTIADGEHEGYLVIEPTADNAVEGSESLVFNLESDPAYVIDTMTILAGNLFIRDADFLVTNTSSNGAGSLRRALSNADDSGGGIVKFDTAGAFAVPRTIVLASSLNINASTTIKGPTAPSSVILDGNGNDRVFVLTGPGTITLRNLTITNGYTDDGRNGGGGILVSTEANAILEDCTVSNNTADGGDGGGISCVLGTLVLRRCTVSGNAATLTYSEGGGVYVLSGSFLMVNSTVSGNAAGGSGGGLHVDASSIGAIPRIISSTITGNVADADNDGVGGGGGVDSEDGVACGNTIIAGNFDTFLTTGNDGPGEILPDLSGFFESLGHNLIGIEDGQSLPHCPSSSFLEPELFIDGVDGDQVGTLAAPLDPRLAPLSMNGGPTETHAPIASSPARDAGDNALIFSPDFDGPPFADQRGAERVAGVAVNIGAVEEGPSAPVVSLVSVDSDASEQALDPGQFFVGRSAPSANPLVINLLIEASSTVSGGDANLSGGSLTQVGTNLTVTIPANESEVLLDLTPVDDSTVENAEVLDLKLQAGAGYLVSSAFREASVTIHDNERIVTNTNDAGPGSLRQGLADLGSAGGGLVRFDPATFTTPMTITLAGPIVIDGAVTLRTPAAAVAPTITAPSSRVFTITSSGDGVVELDGIVIDNANGTGHGGAIQISGADTEVVMDCAVISNSISSARGGAIAVLDGSLTITQSTFTWNTASGGGALYSNGGNLTLSNSILYANFSSDSGGGGILNVAGDTILNQVTVSANSAAGNGGGLSIFDGAASLLATNCTITQNNADSDTNNSGNGGGIWLGGSTFPASAIQNTLMAGNKDNSPGSDDHPDVSGEFTSLGNNLVGIASGLLTTGGHFNGALGDLVGSAGNPIPASLAPLANNGGKTETHLPWPNAAAIDAGEDSAVPFSLDQRDGPRLSGPATDIGAVEALSLIVTNTNNSGAGSLREAINLSNSSGGARVAFSLPAGTNTIALTSGELAISRPVFLDGGSAPGLTVSGSGLSRAFSLTDLGGGIAHFSRLTIADGHTVAGSDGGGVRVSGTGAVLLLESCTLTANHAGKSGGAAYVNLGGALTAFSCTVSGNSADGWGGGFYNTNSTLAVVFCTVTDNVCDANNDGSGDGGGLFMSGLGTFVVGHSIVAGNFDTYVTTGNDGSSVNAIDTGALTGSFGTEGYNLIGTGGSGFSDGVMNDIAGSLVSPVEAYLAPLAWNGGLIRTHALNCGSPALDAGDGAYSVLPATDQRGLPRIFGADPDLGSYEMQYEDYDYWAAHTFPPSTPATETESDADFDDDGLTNGLERLLGSNPLDPRSRGATTANLTANNLIITFTVPKSVDPATVGAEHCTDLVSWSSLGITFEFDDALDPARDLQIIHARIPRDGQTRKFGRIFYAP